MSTAEKSAHYFERFNKDFDFCINREFEKIYATSKNYSWSNASQFKEFCKAANIMCEELNPNKFFKEGMCDGVFLTREYTYDAKILRDYYLEQLKTFTNVSLLYGIRITSILKDDDCYVIGTDNGAEYRASYVLNASYASTNQLLDMVGYEKFKIKYELCEIILCNVNDTLNQYGITVMDGPFFSIMPFGKTNLHSLTSVTFTPHSTSYDACPRFECQMRSDGYCSEKWLGNCNLCKAKPDSAFPYMNNLARKYLKDEYAFEYKESLFSMKPILMSSEVDDSRPTVIRVYSKNPTFVGVLSGKINTVYDLDEVLGDDSE